MQEIQYTVLREGGTPPQSHSEDAAGWDLVACFDAHAVPGYSPENDKILFTPCSDIGLKKPPLGVTVPPGFRVLIPTGIAVALPQGTWMGVYSRSGAALKTGLVVSNGVGVIDSDYRGEIFVIIENRSKAGVRIQTGDRIAQAVMHQSFNSNYQFTLADNLSQTNRGAGGFGSTGKDTQSNA